MDYNPCACLGVPLSYNPPTPSGDDCLQLCHIFIQPADSVGPCGKTGIIDLYKPEGPESTSPHTTTLCDGKPLTWSLAKIETTDLISSASVSGTSLTFVTGPAMAAGKVGMVYVKGQCGIYSQYVQVLIGIKDLCAEVNGDCDPCSGAALQSLANVAITE